jgi:hypothetical protein
VRFDGLPLTSRVASLPELPAGSRVRLHVDAVDLFEGTAACSYRETLRERVVPAGEKA